jgi:hypothetical protein
MLSHRAFLGRIARCASIGALLGTASLLPGMAGYHVLEQMSWLDAFLNAAMLLGGMGPVSVPITEGGKLFAGCYALYCGLVVIAMAGIVLAPVAHRILHRFHLEERDG